MFFTCGDKANWHNRNSTECIYSNMMNYMVLHFGLREFILFDFWKTGSSLGLAGSVLIVFLMSILYEAVKGLRMHLLESNASERQNQSRVLAQSGNTESNLGLVDDVNARTVSYSIFHRFGLNLFSWYRVVQSGLYFVQSLLAYTLMLIAMTFNVWIILGIVFGEAVGYFLFFE